MGTGTAAGGTGRGLDAGAILARIREHRRYPELARRRGVEGAVAVRFTVGGDGSVGDLAVVRGVDPALDEAAREAVLAAAPLPPTGGAVEVEIDFRLRDR